MSEVHDIAVIGAGPVGLFAVFALGQVGLKAVVIDALAEPGGQCTALYPEKPIYDIPGRSAILAGELVGDLLAQAKPYDPHYVLGGRVETMARDGDGVFTLRLTDGAPLRARAVLVAAGAGAFGPNRPPIPGLGAFEGRSVFYAVRSPDRFRGQHVVIAGGGDSAADWAVILAGVAASVTIVHRRAVFRAAPATVSALEDLAGAGRIRLAVPRGLKGLEGEEGRLSHVLVADDAGAIERLPADALLCFFGLAKDLSAIGAWGIEAGRHGIPVAPDSMATCRPGVFAIGDIAHYPGKLKLILTGFAEAACAAHAARAFLHPQTHFHFEYSTSRGRPGPLAAAQAPLAEAHL
jgi:thioredoxin reductase (NADPH)